MTGYDRKPDDSYGKRLVGLHFNPTGDETVTKLKMLFAEIIDIVDGLKADGENERNRLAAIAITETQGAQMWTVKCATWGK